MRLVLMAAFLALATPATAQQCTHSLNAIAHHAKWGQVEIEMLTRENKDGVSIQWRMWVNEETGKWHLTGTIDTTTCLIRSGSNYAGQTIADFLDGPAA